MSTQSPATADYRWPTLWAAVFGLIFGLYVAIDAAWAARRNEQALRWPTADAAIVRSSVKVNATPKGGKAFVPEVTYRYSVGAKAYEGHRVAFGSPAQSSGCAEATVARYPPRARVVAFVDPDDPAVAVLEPGPLSGRNDGDFVFGLVFAGFGATTLLCLALTWTRPGWKQKLGVPSPDRHHQGH